VDATAAAANWASATVLPLRRGNARSSTDGGYEYNLVLIAAMLAITETGPGRPSVDDRALPRLKGNTVALAQFAAAAVASTLLTAEREPAAEQAPAEDEVTAPRHERFAREPAHVEVEATS